MDQLLVALLNTFPAALALIVVLYAVLRLVKRLNAATRYAIWWIALVAILAMPLFFYAFESESEGQAESVAVISGEELQTAQTSGRAHIIESPEELPALHTLLALGSAFMLFRLALSYRSIRRLKRQSIAFPADLSQFPRRFRLLLSKHIASPLAVGFFRPAIIFPEALVSSLNPEELNKILTHEYAHLARRDDWMNLIGRMVQVVTWFHPLVWFILHQLETQREFACDDWVVHRTGDARGYAATLLHITELRLNGPEHCLATGFLGRKAQLSHRVEELLSLGRTFRPKMARTTFALSFFALLALTIGAGQLPGFIQIRTSTAKSADSTAQPELPANPRSLLSALKAAGYGDLDVDDIINLKNNGVSPRFITEISRVAPKSSVKDLIELHRHGVNASHIIKAREYKTNLTMEQIVRLKNSGVLD